MSSAGQLTTVNNNIQPQLLPGPPNITYEISKGTDEMLYSTGKNIKEVPDKYSFHLDRIVELITGTPPSSNHNYWQWDNGMRTYLLFLYSLIIFGIAVFIFKLIAFTSILSHKGLVENNPLVRYLTSGIQQGFENMQYEPKYTISGIIYSIYLGITSCVQSLPQSLRTFDKSVITLKRNISKDLFQPVLLKYVMPVMDSFSP